MDANTVGNLISSGNKIEVESMTKNEYIALELTKTWCVGRGGATMLDMLAMYDKALRHLEG